MDPKQIAQELVARFGKESLKSIEETDLQALFQLVNYVNPSNMGDFYYDDDVFCVPEGENPWRYIKGQGWVR